MSRIQSWALPVLHSFADGHWHRGTTEAAECMVETGRDFKQWAVRALRIGVALANGWLERETAPRDHYDWLRITPAGRAALASASNPQDP